MQPALQTQDPIANPYAEESQQDFTPSGVFPIGRAHRALPERSEDEPFIVVHELPAIEAAQVALLEQGLDEEEWDEAEDGEDHTFELAPVTVDLQLPIVGQDWQEDEETTRFMRGVPVLLPRAFGRADLQRARDLAADLSLAASSPGVVDPFSSPWQSAKLGVCVGLTTTVTPERTWRDWLLVAAVTFAAEAALLTSLALAFG
ncbi:MAG: hypothetical protein JRI23_12095 [Deltaproteobacteria bacterium]|jgi:hypothetical protein|nr:hypothetical protein [Deltaproteobacteria bacterium]MBW2532450.1 hypothetical protein [Deltaproteobacteria bacterium]